MNEEQRLSTVPPASTGPTVATPQAAADATHVAAAAVVPASSAAAGPLTAPAAIPLVASAAGPTSNPKRRKALTAVAAVLALFAAGYDVLHYVVGGRCEETDNAYVQGNLIQITPQVGGTVLAIHADDTDFVKAGQPLVRLDPADAQVALVV